MSASRSLRSSQRARWGSPMVWIPDRSIAAAAPSFASPPRGGGLSLDVRFGKSGRGALDSVSGHGRALVLYSGGGGVNTGERGHHSRGL